MLWPKSSWPIPRCPAAARVTWSILPGWLPPQTAKIGVGRDAADVSFMPVFTYTMFGPHEVSVTPVGQAEHCHCERSQFVLGCV